MYLDCKGVVFKCVLEHVPSEEVVARLLELLGLLQVPDGCGRLYLGSLHTRKTKDKLGLLLHP